MNRSVYIDYLIDDSLFTHSMSRDESEEFITGVAIMRQSDCKSFEEMRVFIKTDMLYRLTI